MTWAEAIILGIVQGLTEFLPISSSAHLRIVGELLPGAGDPGAAFTAITQLGTETAVLVYFRKDIRRIIVAWWRSLRGLVPRNSPDARMGWLVILGSIPIAVLGLLFQTQIETTLRSLWIVAGTLIVFGILLGVADRIGRRTRDLTHLTYRHGILFGFAQSLALIPGVSRSGGTITAGLLMGYTRQAAARYSFLLAIPAVFASGLYQLAKSYDEPGTYTLLETGVATGVAFVVALAVIGWFLRYISSRSYLLFAGYRIALGGILLILLTTQTINA